MVQNKAVPPNFNTQETECRFGPITIHCAHSAGEHVRLVDGRNVVEGRLEVYHEHKWGTVCSEGFDDIDAQVVCNMLGFS